MPKKENMVASAIDFGAPIGAGFRPPKLSHLVAARLREQIVSGRLKPGTLLMTESHLLETFKVSRPTLREALRVLEAEQLISVGRGMRSGATVLGPSIQKAAEYTNLMLVSDGVTVYDLQEARRFFEPAIVRSLTGPALTNAVGELRTCINDISAALDDQRYIDIVSLADRFHEQLARASGNKTILHLVGMVHSISSDAQASAIAATRPDRQDALHENMTKTLIGYTTLCELLEQGKAHEAAVFWDRYMTRSLEFLRRSKLGNQLLAQPVSR